MPRALLAIFLSLFATAAFANRTPCTEDPMAPNAKPDKPAATPAPATAPANHAPVAATIATVPGAAPATASANGNGGATHPSRPRMISPRWQSLLPGMIR